MNDEFDMAEVEIEKKLRDLEFQRKEILDLDITHIQWFVWDFTKAYENGDMKRCGRIMDIFITLSKNKAEIPTLQEYFGGEKIGKYKGTVHIDRASQWITFIGEKIKGMTDHSIKAEPIN